MIDKLMDLFYCANSLMLNKDESELAENSNERTVCALLMCKMNQLLPLFGFDGYYADVEYSRGPNGTIKTIEGPRNASWIVADIIIHSRGEKDADNLLCLEMKRSYRNNASKNKDKERLQYMTSGDHSYIDNNRFFVSDYKLGIYYEYNSREKSIYLEFYKNGEMFNMITLTFEEAKKWPFCYQYVDNKFKFHPVGQGLFYSGLIDDGNYSFVYDCGTESKKIDLTPMIEAFKNEIVSKKLDFLSISHFHDDHINYVPQLISILNPTTIVLPYLFSNSDLRLLYIFGSNYSKDVESFNYETVLSIDAYYDRDTSIIVKEEKTINEHGWIFKFFNRSISKQDELDLVEDFHNLLSKYGVSSIRNLLLARKFKDIKAIYDKLFGKNKFNLTSMVMLHYPSNVDSKYLVLYKNTYHYGFKPFNLLTGDVEIDNYLAKCITSSFSDSLPQGILQIPHHGSQFNWVNFNSYFSPFNCNVVSFGTKNRYGHPYSSIMSDVYPNDYFEVTEKNHFIYHILFK